MDDQGSANEVDVDVSGDVENANDDESEWQEYDPVIFGPDILPVSGSADPASASSHSSTDTHAVVTESTSGGNQPSTSVLDESDAVILNLVSLSAQRSFSNLNIDNPYRADADFGFDF
jgi:hypothetical protein